MHKILIVDDERRIINILEEFLTKSGYKIITALGGAEAKDILRSKTTIDLMMLDLKMPAVDGIDVLKEQRRLETNIPVIILTGSIDAIDHVSTLKDLGYGNKDLLFKPFDLYELLDAVTKKLSSRVKIKKQNKKKAKRT